MVEEVQRSGQTYYLCPEGGLAYSEEQWAQRCEEFCSRHHVCSLEVT